MKARKIEKIISKNTKEVDVHISQYRDIIENLKTEIEQLKLVIKNQQISNQIKRLSMSIKEEDFSELKKKETSEINNNNSSDGKTPEKNIKKFSDKSLPKDSSEKISSTLKHPILRSELSSDASPESHDIRKSSLNSKKQKTEFQNNEGIEGSNLLLYSNNASLISANANNILNISSNQQSIGNINRSNGLPNSSSINKNYGNNLNSSNLSGNNNNNNNNNNQINNNGSSSCPNANNNSKNLNNQKQTYSLLSNYSKSHVLKEKRYANMPRKNYNNPSSQISQEGDKDKSNSHLSSNVSNSVTPKKTKNEANSRNVNLNSPYIDYKKFQRKNEEDDYDIDEFARNFDK